jgi:acetoin utilization deacetylase AcuC-like enzyme
MWAFYCDHYRLPLPVGHTFPIAKYGALRERVQLELPGVQLAAPEPASEGELALVHTPTYIDAVFHNTLSVQVQREIGFPWSPEMVWRSRYSVGSTIAAARAALKEGVSTNLAGGTHHASAHAGGGFCVFNDVAVAARLMQAEWHRHSRSLLRVAVIDLDVHQGNGTAAIFERDDTVYTLSLHGARNFPFRKVDGDLDVALPDGCEDAQYLAALEAALVQLWARFEPGLVFYIAGADPYRGDRLGRLSLSAEGLAERDRRVFAQCFDRRVPIAMAMGGGYGRVMEETVSVQMGSVRAAYAAWQVWADTLKAA